MTEGGGGATLGVSESEASKLSKSAKQGTKSAVCVKERLYKLLHSLWLFGFLLPPLAPDSVFGTLSIHS